MVSAGQVNSDLSDATSIFKNYTNTIESVQSSWTGQSYDNLKSKASIFSGDYLQVVTQQMNSFAEAVGLYEQYLAAKSNYSTAQSNKDSSAAATYQSKISQLKGQIENCLASISTKLEGTPISVSTGSTTTASGAIEYKTFRYVSDTNSGTTIWYAVIPKDHMPLLAVGKDNYNKMTSEAPSAIAQRKGAVLGVNCCITGTGSGILYTDGHLVSNNWTSGEGQTLYMTQDGKLEVVTNNRTSVKGILSQNPVWATQGFYTIIRDGKFDQWNTDIAKSKHPRTFIGQDYDGNYIVGVCTGRQKGEAGMNFQEIYDFVTTQVSNNVRILYNADGGGSSAFVYNGQKLNPNTDNGGKTERARPDLIYWT